MHTAKSQKGRVMKTGSDNEDLRIKKTKRAVKEAFYSLLSAKDFEKISVKDISDRAMISRNTFYLHYSDKYDLLNHICDELCRALYIKLSTQLQRAQSAEINIDNVSYIIMDGINEIIQNREKYHILFAGSSRDVLVSKLHELARRVFMEIGPEKYGIDGCSMEYICAGMTGVIKYFVDNDAYDLREQSYNFTRIHLGSIIKISEQRKEYENK